jgi:hypothetical protein
MVAPNKARRISPEMTPRERRRAVVRMLREIGALMRAAREANRQAVWPTTTAPAGPIPTDPPTTAA